VLFVIQRRDRGGGQAVRAGHVGVVRGFGGGRCQRYSHRPGCSEGVVTDLWVGVHHLPRGDRIHRPGVGGAGHHRGGSPLRRHGPLRASPDHPGLVSGGVPGAGPELFGAGGADPAHPGGGHQPVLFDPAGVGAAAHGGAGDRGHRDRLAVGDLRGVQRHPPSGSAGVSAADEHPAHLGQRGGAGVLPDHQLGVVPRGGGVGGGLRVLSGVGIGLRGRGDRHVRVEHHLVPGGGPQDLA